MAERRHRGREGDIEGGREGGRERERKSEKSEVERKQEITNTSMERSKEML
jgi:hypothetical protein